ncbi:MAG: nucleotidyltransferase family protein [Vicinamibacterales bacterium]
MRTFFSKEPWSPEALMEAFLRSCARIELDDHASDRLCAAAERVRDWPALIARAEDHGLSPLLRRHVRSLGLQVPAIALRQLDALAVRHRVTSHVQFAVLGDVLAALDASGISSLVLKGAALAPMLYPEPELRPMRDLDILVAPGDGVRAQRVLRRMGFNAPLVSAMRHSHHHLPGAVCDRDGFRIMVEIHEDAITRDDPETLSLRALSGPPHEVETGGRRFRCFGPVDMLRHLCAHVLERRRETRLVNVTDLVEYATRHSNEIDWTLVAREYPRVVNTIALMHYVVPLPAALDALRPPESVLAPAGVGQNLVPLATLQLRGKGLRQTVRELLYPSPWWMHAYYGVPVHRPLFRVRWGRHVRTVAYWGLRRIRTAWSPWSGAAPIYCGVRSDDLA